MKFSRPSMSFESLMSRRFPTLLGLGLLVLGVVGGVLLVGEGTGGFLPRASAEYTPQQVRITNITENSFSVSFLTEQATQGMVRFGAGGALNQEARDDRDQLTGQAGAYQTHHVTVRNLQSQTEYTFRLVTQNGQVFDNNGQPFSVRTARPSEPVGARSAYGSVLNQAGNSANGALVYLTTSGGSPLSAYVKSDGSWSIPLAQLRTQDLSAVFPVQDSTSFSVQVVGSSTADRLNFTVTAGQLSPLETLQFGADIPASLTQGGTQDQSGTGGAEPSTETETDGTGLGSNSFTDFLSEEDRTSVEVPSEVSISFPTVEAEVVSTTKPELSGQAPPGVVLQIEVHSEGPQYGVVQTDAQGNWNWTPPDDLEPGEHTVTITYTDENGEQVRQSRTFLVMANSSLPAFESTPSGQLASPSPSPVAVVVPSPSSTPLPSPLPTPTPSPILVPSPTPVPQTPVSGSTGPILGLAGGAALLVGVGAYARRWIPTRYK